MGALRSQEARQALFKCAPLGPVLLRTNILAPARWMTGLSFDCPDPQSSIGGELSANPLRLFAQKSTGFAGNPTGSPSEEYLAGLINRLGDELPRSQNL